MNITTKDQLSAQDKLTETCWLNTDTLSEEVIIDTIPYLYEKRETGEVTLIKGDGEKVTFQIELNKPFENINLTTEPLTDRDVKHLERPDTLTAQQVNDVIQNWDSDGDGFGYTVQERKFIRGLGNVEFIEQEGGEGEGDHYHVIFKAGSKLWKLDGFYSSWEGTEFDDEAYEVEPVQVKVTEYKRV